MVDAVDDFSGHGPQPSEEDLRLAVAGAKRLVATLSASATDLKQDWPRLGDEATKAGRTAVDDALATAKRVLSTIEDEAASRGTTNT